MVETYGERVPMSLLNMLCVEDYLLRQEGQDTPNPHRAAYKLLLDQSPGKKALSRGMGLLD
jgi:hypothetical protein